MRFALNLTVLETDRLLLRMFSTDDAEFVLELVNGPSFVQFIGDKGVRSIEDARRYLLDGPIASYEQHGFGLFLVTLKADQAAIGLCGLVKRDSLKDADIGFAFLPAFWSKGYAVESASAVIALANSSFGLTRILAIANPENARSIRVLEKLGLRFEQMMRLPEDRHDVALYGMDL